jgi:hypothetical protein
LATIEASATTDFDESNVEDHRQDTFSSGNGLSTHSSLNSTSIEDGNGDGRGVVDAVATFLFHHLTNAADDLQSSFDTCNGSAADIESSGITQQSHLTSSYVSEETFNVESSNASAEPQEQTGKTLADIYLDIERAIDEDNARAQDINVIPPTSRGHAVAEEVLEASDETFDERILSNNETVVSKTLCTPENSAWEKELAPRDGDLKDLERKLSECARLESTSVKYEEMSTVPTSALQNVIGQSFKISPRIRDKAMKLKTTRKGSRYNGSYARKTTEPTVKNMAGSRISPVKCVGTTLEADIDAPVGDAFSPAKTADITEDASIGFGSAEKNAVL